MLIDLSKARAGSLFKIDQSTRVKFMFYSDFHFSTLMMEARWRRLLLCRYRCL